ncbi:MAG TPA: M90 family metallopeptidase [Dokdonella sp.]|nr:M90 family metallopeptidase [Dokdonella sp.]
MGWLTRLRDTLQPPARIADADWNALIASSALFGRLHDADRDALRTLTALFLARKAFSAAGGHVLEPAHALAIAALASLSVLHLGRDALAGWHEVIVYPGEFRVKREHHDEHSGVVTEGDDVLIGEAWERGPLILSWADVATDLAHPFDGFNVVAHEMAHKLDLLDGAMNGVPALPRAIPRREWIAAMQAGFDRLERAVERGRDTFIDPYAAESAEEYFAVVSELHFSDPAGLARAEPAVAALLARYYGGA